MTDLLECKIKTLHIKNNYSKFDHIYSLPSLMLMLWANLLLREVGNKSSELIQKMVIKYFIKSIRDLLRSSLHLFKSHSQWSYDYAVGKKNWFIRNSCLNCGWDRWRIETPPLPLPSNETNVLLFFLGHFYVCS